MYKISYEITIEGLKNPIKTVNYIQINTSIKTLGDTAEFEIPTRIWNRQIKPTDKKDETGKDIIQSGKEIIIKLGYNDDLKIEFIGYLTKIIMLKNSVKIQCEDALYLFRKKIDNMEFPGKADGKPYVGSVQSILQYIVEKTNSKNVVICDFDVKYDKFVINNQTGYDALKKLHDDLKLNIYFVSHRDNEKLDKTELHVHSIESDKYGNNIAVYNFSQNIEFANLEHKNQGDRSTFVIVKGFEHDGTSTLSESTLKGNKLITHAIYGMNKENLNTIADEIQLQKTYTGYEKSIETWLIPYCIPGYWAKLTDESGEFVEGTFFATDVKILVASPFSDKPPGCRRIITLEREKRQK